MRIENKQPQSIPLHTMDVALYATQWMMDTVLRRQRLSFENFERALDLFDKQFVALKHTQEVLNKYFIKLFKVCFNTH